MSSHKGILLKLAGFNIKVIKTRFSRLLSDMLTGESRLITGRKPGFSDSLLEM
jgi:hypothetical protein